MTTINNNRFGLDATGTGVVGSLGEAVRFAGGAWGRAQPAANYFTAADKAVVVTDAGTNVNFIRGSVFGRSPTMSGPVFANQVAIRLANGATGTHDRRQRRARQRDHQLGGRRNRGVGATTAGNPSRRIRSTTTAASASTWHPTA